MENLKNLLLRLTPEIYHGTTMTGFLCLLLSTCSNYMLSPIRDATALSIGVHYIPSLTLTSTFLALISSVPIGWLFEAPDPNRRHIFRKMGLTRGETQGSSLALFYRMFAAFLALYGVCIKVGPEMGRMVWLRDRFGTVGYVVFFLVVHLMKLHSVSLVWGVTSEAMEYEEAAENRKMGKDDAVLGNGVHTKTRSSLRLKRLAFVGFGGTVGGILGSIIASIATHKLRLSGLLLLSALLLHFSANLSIQLGHIMYKYWLQEQQILIQKEQQQQLQQQNNNNPSDTSIKRISSSQSMKRISSGNSLHRIQQQQQQLQNVKKSSSDGNLLNKQHQALSSLKSLHNNGNSTTPNKTMILQPPPQELDDDTFKQRLLRGITTILRSKLLMSIFTYNALYASTSVLLSFLRAKLISDMLEKNTESQTAFLARINTFSSISIFLFQISGVGANIAHFAGMRGTLCLMPVLRFLGVVSFYAFSKEKDNLLLLLVLDELCKVINLGIAKPVRESLWRGLSSEARYEAKPIVDTLANRWGGGSAAFLVQCIDWVLYRRSSGEEIRNDEYVLILCILISLWWWMVSLHLGMIRTNIDIELKKRI